jgi:histidinol-phosphatase (PHP family)
LFRSLHTAIGKVFAQNRMNSSKIRIDYHTHNFRCGHAQGQIEEYIQSAIGKGLSEIGISDHIPIYFLDGNDPLPSTAMAKDEFAGYVDEVLALKAKYSGQIEVRFGVECDYIETMEGFYRAELAKYPFDYVIGSVHYTSDGSGVYDSRRWKNDVPMEAYADYYRLLAKSAQSGLFDILAHASAITAYAPKPIPEAIIPLQDAALEVIAATNQCLEINTSGYRKMTTDPFPTVRMVRKAHMLGIPFTFSSDCHRPSDVGYYRDVVERLLDEIGVTELASFKGRQRLMQPLLAAPQYV